VRKFMATFRALALTLTLACTFAAGDGRAREAQPVSADPALEARVMLIAEELRCLVCQNETIAASQADLAKDLRAQIRLQLQQGRSSQEILDFMVARYGDFVLYRPPLQPSTLLLWAGPFILLVLAGGWLVMRVRQRSAPEGQGLTPDELRRLQKLLDQGGTS